MIWNSGTPALSAALQSFETTQASALGRSALQRRYDSKYLVAPDRLLDLLAAATRSYRLLPAGTALCASYSTLYFDTPEHHCFIEHVRGRRPRWKVRVRHYLDRNVSYLEIKSKTNHEQTRKKRRTRAFRDADLVSDDRQFIAAVSPLDSQRLQPTLWTDFQRVTLVGDGERVTIDLGLRFRRSDAPGTADHERAFPGLVLAEVKQGRRSHRSPIVQALREVEARSTSFSKYCVGLALTRADLTKTNTLIPILRNLEGTAHAA